MKHDVLFQTVKDALEEYTKETGIKASAKLYSDSVGVFIEGEGRAFNILEIKDRGSFVPDNFLGLSFDAKKAWKKIVQHVKHRLHDLIDQYFREHKDETFACRLNEEEIEVYKTCGEYPPRGMEKGCPFCKDRYECRYVRTKV